MLGNLSKTLARCLYNQLYPFVDKILSIQLRDFQRVTTQHCIVRLIQKWKTFLNQGLVLDVLLTDLSKTF